MIAPAVMWIESAADSLKSAPDFIRDSQMKELTSFGDARAKQIGASGVSDDFKKGYELGLQTARTVLATSATLIMKGVNPLEVL